MSSSEAALHLLVSNTTSVIDSNKVDHGLLPGNGTNDPADLQQVRHASPRKAVMSWAVFDRSPAMALQLSQLIVDTVPVEQCSVRTYASIGLSQMEALLSDVDGLVMDVSLLSLLQRQLASRAAINNGADHNSVQLGSYVKRWCKQQVDAGRVVLLLDSPLSATQYGGMATQDLHRSPQANSLFHGRIQTLSKLASLSDMENALSQLYRAWSLKPSSRESTRKANR